MLSKPPKCIHLTNRFHVAVRLLSNRSQMTSKCGKNKKVAHEAIAECVTDFDVICDLLLNRRTATWNLLVLYNNEEKALFTSKSFKIEGRPLRGLREPPPTLTNTKKKPFDVVYCLYKMKQSHWLLCVAKNCDWSRKITPLSHLI